MATVTEQTTPLWHDGKNGNIQFISSWKRLEKEDPATFALVKMEEGFECADVEFSYKCGRSKYGLYLSRRKKNSFSVPTPTVQQTSNNIAPEARPPAFINQPLDKTPQNSQPLIAIAEQLLKLSAVIDEISQALRGLATK